jgi:hypothetical protein
MKTIQLFLIPIYIFLTTALNAQEVEWSELVKSAGRGTQIYPDKGKDFYTVIYSGGYLAGSLKLQRHEDFLPVAAQKIQKRTESGTGSINDYILINGQMVVFLSDKVDMQNKLYYQIYSKDCLPTGEPIQIAEYTIPKGWKRSSYFNVIQSKNKEFFEIEYSIPGGKNENDRFGYKVLDNLFNVVSEGEYESPYPSKESDFTNHYLSNTGDLFIGMKVYNVNEKGKVRDFSSLRKYLVFLIQNGELTEMELAIGDKRVTDVTFSSDDKRVLTCTGLYGEGNVGTKGVFYFQMDFKNQEIINEGFSEFKKDFITQDYTDRQKEKAEKNEAKGKGTPQLYNYDFREVHTAADGGIVVVMEQYYMVVTTYTDSKGNTRTTYTYYYNDIITYRVKESGEFEWIQKINKRQVSTNDGGYYSSIGGYFTDNKFVLFFNDNNKNYLESGEFEKPEKGVASASYRKKTNCVASVELDLNTGDFTRKLYTSRAETNAYAVPKRFEVDYVNNEMFMYFQYGKKEKFGLLKF